MPTNTSNQENDVLLPPEFEAIAYIIYGSDYKAQLDNLIKNVPRDLLDNDQWWADLKAVTKVNNTVIANTRKKFKEQHLEKEKATGKAFKKLSETPAFESDPELQKAVETLSEQLTQNSVDLKQIQSLKKLIQSRLEVLDATIRSQEEKLGKNPTESKNEKGILITEGMFSKLITKVRQYLASDAFKSLLGIEEDGAKANQTIAKLIIRDILQIVADKSYEALKGIGIDRRTLDKAFKTRNEPDSQEIIKKAVGLLRKKIKTPSATQPTQPVQTQEKPVQAPPVQTPVQAPPVQTPGKPVQAPPVQKQPRSNVEILQNEAVKAGLRAKAQGIDPIQAVENKLQEFEEKGLDDAAIVRRNWERHKAKIKRP